MKNKNLIMISTILLIIIVSSLLIMSILNPQKGKLISLNYKEITNKVKKEETFILLISRSTCSHCSEYKPKLESIAKKYNIDIYYIDYDLDTKENQDKLLDDYKLDGSTPITIFIKNGKQTNLFDRIEGDIEKETAISKFKKLGFIK